MLPGLVIPPCAVVIRIGHSGNGVHHRADGGPVLAAGRHIGVGALAEHIAGHIVPRLVQPLRGIHQKPLHRLGLALSIGVLVVDGPRLLVLVRAVREADVVELDLVEPQRRGLQRQLRLVLPHRAVVGAGPVHTADLQRRAAEIGDHILRVVGSQVGVIEHRDASDSIEPGVPQLLHVGPEILHGVLGRRIGRRAVLLHHRRGIGHRRAVHNVHHEGVDARALGQPDIAVRILDGAAVEIQRPHLVGHHVVRERGLLRGVIVQPRRVAAAPGVAPGGMELIQRLVILGQRFLLRHTHVLSVDEALAPFAGHLPPQHFTAADAVKPDDSQGHALFHGAAGHSPRLVRQAHAPQGVHRLRQHRVLRRHRKVSPLHIQVADLSVQQAVLHAHQLRAAVHVLLYALHRRPPQDTAQRRPLRVLIGRRVLRLRCRIHLHRLQHGGAQLPVHHPGQGRQRRRAQDDHHRGRARPSLLLFFR